MADDRIHKWELTRRRVLAAIAGGGLAGWAGGALGQPSGPWGQPPKSKVDRVNFVVWTYGDIYTKIARQFEADWGVKVDATISSVNDHPTKLVTMYAARETIDVSQSTPFSFPNFVNQSLVEPIDDLPGAADYIKDFTPFTRQVATIEGKTWGLPYFSTVWVWNYYADMMEKLKIDKPFTTYDEFIAHCVKAKKDGVSRHPVLWVAGVGHEQLPGTWYQLTWNRGGTFFDKQGNHMLGPGSIARETLKWWANTFEQGLDIADPESLKVQFVTSAKAYSAGKNLYRGPNHHYTITTCNDPAQSPIAGKVKVHGSPGEGRTIGATSVYFLSAANRDKEWAWKLLQYLGGKTKDGNYTQAVNLAKDAMLGSGYTSVMNGDAVKQGWARWGDVPSILKIWDQAAYIGEACSSVYQPWHFPWSDQLNIEVQKCLTGQLTADQCCDNLIKGIADAKRKV
jgi:ABC-type glycerol-3-phosphate transport system substrate-binding protein